MEASEGSLNNLDKMVETHHDEVSARLDLISVNMEDLRKLVLAQNNDGDEHSSTKRSLKNNDDNGRKQLYALRILKVDFPLFDGKKVKEWLYKCDQFFSLDFTPNDAKVRLASIYLEGPALQWHVNYMKSKFNIYPSWTKFVVDVTQRFGEVFEDPLAELMQVKQTGLVQEYIEAFELASTQVTFFPE